MYQVFHYQNDEWKHSNDMSQKLYHGSTIATFSVYDKEQFFFKTMTSFSTKDYVAKEFAAQKGMIFILDKGFNGLYDGALRGANVQWLSDFDEYEYIILPTTYNKIIEFIGHGLLLHPAQNVYITCCFNTNINPLLPHSDTVSGSMKIDYTKFKKDNSNYTKQLQENYDANVNRRRTNLCNIIDCDFQHHNTIPSTQLDITVFSTTDLQHIEKCHPHFYLRLETFTDLGKNEKDKKQDDGYEDEKKDNNKQPKWENIAKYFIQITLVELEDFNIKLTVHQPNNPKKYFVKEVGGNKIGNVVRIKKGKQSGDTEIQLDEQQHEYYLGLYENKETIHLLSNVIHLVTVKDNTYVPPKNMNYKPNCIDLSTVRKVKDEKNKKVKIYWD
eukprot:461639_1